jgi:hypothetical protein
MDPFAQALNQLISALDSVGIRYAVGGSLASSAHGAVRATQDGDIVAAIVPVHLAPLARALGSDWYADVPMMEAALRAGRSFNLIHTGSALKFDIFPASTDFHAAQLARAMVVPLHLVGATPCAVATAEDILLAKLRWYLDGGETSERQWNDVVGLIRINPSLDLNYLQLWAGRLGVTHLLEKAQSDARLE